MREEFFSVFVRLQRSTYIDRALAPSLSEYSLSLAHSFARSFAHSLARWLVNAIFNVDFLRFRLFSIIRRLRIYAHVSHDEAPNVSSCELAHHIEVRARQ